MSLSESARSLIHTLTLAIGHGTDAQATARTFLVTLVKHCPLDGAALWWRDLPLGRVALKQGRAVATFK